MDLEINWATKKTRPYLLVNMDHKTGWYNSLYNTLNNQAPFGFSSLLNLKGLGGDLIWVYILEIQGAPAAVQVNKKALLQSI